MKRAATILGVAAALAIPATASAGNSVQVKPQLKPQIFTTQIAMVQVARDQRASVARQTVQRATAYRIKLKRMAR